LEGGGVKRIDYFVAFGSISYTDWNESGYENFGN
jgi:hypothetical protein